MNDVPSSIPSASAPPAPQSSASEGALPRARPVERRLRLWPGVVVVVLQWLVIVAGDWFSTDPMTQFFARMWAPLVGAGAVVLWWLIAARARWLDRLLIPLACAALGAVAFFSYHPSFGVFGLILYAIPVVTTVWVVWLLVTPFLRWPVRRLALLLLIVLAWQYFALLRLEGVTGGMSPTLAYRWQRTAEEQFLTEHAGREPVGDQSNAASAKLGPGDWPGFRGPERDGRCAGVRIDTDWKQRPPRLLWRHRVGPGWSSFALVGARLYAQEQRGPNEVVVCYDANSGSELWVHEDAARFTEVAAGPGPRATPTFHEGNIYAQGAAGRLNCLDAATGQPRWSRDLIADTGATTPTWGFAASPLVAQGLVTVYAGGPDGKSVAAYHAASGDPAWFAGDGKDTYCSTHLARLGGAAQVLIATGAGLTSFDPLHGTILWQHDWPVDQNMNRVVQPALVGNDDVLLGTGFTFGVRRLHIGREGNTWTAANVSTIKSIKPYFNDLVVHRGHIFGFDGSFLTCVSLEDGKGKWKARGYGNGQVLLLADQDLLLVLSEKGEVALVDAVPAAHTERARFQAIEGKTWNHPVVAHGKLLVRNGEEAACYVVGREGG